MNDKGETYGAVLILVLMEDTLRAYVFLAFCLGMRLNPCFNGRYSQSYECVGCTVKQSKS